ncbi:hypothetical protein ACIBF5_32515, partial [Micromonospora sp. NPDC050417]
MSTPVAIVGELYVKGQGWVDITEDMRQGVADSGGGVTITRGIQSEGTDADPGLCSIVLNNRHGKYSPRNPGSPYYGLIGRNSPFRLGVRMARDDFGRAVSGAWGVTPTGQAWGHAGSATWSVAGGTARCSMATADNYNKAELFATYRDVEQVTTIIAPVTAGAPLVVGHVARVQENGDCLFVRASMNPSGSVSLTISRWHSTGGLITLATLATVPGLSYNGTPIRLRSSVVGSRLACKAWPASGPEPLGWQLQISTTEGPTQPGRCGHHIWLVTGNTTTKPYLVQVDNYEVISRRVTAEVPAWPPRWDLSGRDRWVPIEAAGILRRLGQGARPLSSPLRRAFDHAGPELIAYYPLEDGRDVDLAASGLVGRPPMTEIGRPPGVTQIGTGDVDGTAEWGVAGSGGAASLVGLRNGGRLRVNIPPSGATSWTFEAVARYDAGTDIGVDSIMFTLRQGGQWEWSLGHAGNGNPGEATYFMIAGSVDGSVSGAALTYPHDPYDGILHHYRVDALRNGANTDYWIYIDGEPVASGTWTAFTGPPPDMLTVNHYLGSGPDQPAVGHLAVSAPSLVGTVGDRPAATRAWIGEPAGVRMVRLSAETGVPVHVVGDPADTAPMGPQGIDTLLDLLRHAQLADGGLLTEARDAIALVYRPVRTLY